MTLIDSLVKSETLETVNFSLYEKFRKILNRHFAEPFKVTLSIAQKQKSWHEPILVVVRFHPFVITFLMEIASISWIFMIHI